LKSLLNLFFIALLIACSHKTENKPSRTTHILEKANCADSKELASEVFNSQTYYSIFPEDALISFTEDPPLEIYIEALENITQFEYCLLYTSDAADDLTLVHLV